MTASRATSAIAQTSQQVAAALPDCSGWYWFSSTLKLWWVALEVKLKCCTMKTFQQSMLVHKACAHRKKNISSRYVMHSISVEVCKWWRQSKPTYRLSFENKRKCNDICIVKAIPPSKRVFTQTTQHGSFQCLAWWGHLPGKVTWHYAAVQQWHNF